MDKSLFNPVGLVGVGAMGMAALRNLVAARRAVIAFDLNTDRLRDAGSAGATAARDATEVVRSCPLVITSLPSSEAFVRFADEVAIPQASRGQVFVELGTTAPPEVRRIAQALTDRGAALLDVPVSGGPGGVEQRTLRMFAGGDRATFDHVRPVLADVGGDQHITYCGPSGAGMVVKGVNQLMMGLVAAAHLEAISFGVNAGVDAQTILTAVGGTGFLRGDFAHFARQVLAGTGKNQGVKFRELPYFLHEARDGGFPLPITGAVHAFCAQGERLVIDDNRPAPSFWNELTCERRAVGTQPTLRTP